MPHSMDTETKAIGHGLKRYSLVIPESIFNEVQRTAEEEHTSIIDLLRRFIKLGLLISKISKDPNSQLIIREGDKEREILFFT